MPKKKITKTPFLLPLKSDFVFKLVFGDTRRIALLTSFLQAVLELPAEEYGKVVIVDPHVKREYNRDKAGILDVKVHTKSGNIIDIEIQVEPEAPLEKRIRFYQAKMITEQIGEGIDYEVIKPVISIIITDFNFIKHSPAYHHRFRFYDVKNSVEFTDAQEINVLELPKLPAYSDATELFDWMSLIRAKNAEEYDMLAKKKPVFGEVVAVVKQFSADERARAEYEQHELWRMDQAVIQRVKFQKGKAEGKAEKAADIARNMKGKRLDSAFIAEMTGLSPNEIERL
jgi:predicted transposase/invertase (TIGR01784 family)